MKMMSSKQPSASCEVFGIRWPTTPTHQSKVHKYTDTEWDIWRICGETVVIYWAVWWGRVFRCPTWSLSSVIQCRNFNWNKIHNLDIGNFCKKSRNRSIFAFPCPHFGVYGFCLSVSESSQSPLTFFFKWKGMPCDTSFKRLLSKKYNAPFVSWIFSKPTC
jgi:hypothetical protein